MSPFEHKMEVPSDRPTLKQKFLDWWRHCPYDEARKENGLDAQQSRLGQVYQQVDPTMPPHELIIPPFTENEGDRDA